MTTSRSRASTGRAATPTRKRRRIITTPIEHHAILDAVEWLVEHEGAEVTWLPVGADGSVATTALREALEDHDDVALVTIMWANNEVGTIMPIAELAAIAAEFDVPMHSDAIQAVGQLPVDFAASGLSAMSIAAHKFGGPTGVGALLLRRDTACVPLLHGGGQERDVRSGTPDVAGAVAMAAAAQVAVDGLDANRARISALRDRLIDGVLSSMDDVDLNGADGDARLPGNTHFTFRGCEGDALLMLLDAKGIECSTGSACTAGVAQPSHVLIAMGADPASARGSLRLSLGHTSTDADVDAALAVLPAAVDRARQAALASAGPEVAMRVLVAMSGGVDSSVAAARMVDAGHDVVGVHLALSSAPGTLRTGSRGCCSKEDAGDARRVADILDIPFYVWDFADRFKEDVIDDFVASYARGETPNPCVRCNEKIKFSALSARALALGFDALATGHYARLADGRLRRAVDADKDQSYVLGVLNDRAAGDGDLPDRRHPQAADPRGGRPARPRRRRQAGQPRHLLHPVGGHPGVPRCADRRPPRRRRRRRRHRAGRARRRARVHDRPAQGPRHRRTRSRRPPALRDVDRRRERHGARRRRRAISTCGRLVGERPVFTSGSPLDGPVECEVQVRAHGGIADAVGGGPRRHPGRHAPQPAAGCRDRSDDGAVPPGSRG